MMNIATNKNTVSFLKSMTARRLLPSDIVFSHISFVNDQRVAFRMEPVFNAGDVFGLAPIPNESVSVTAYYEMSRRTAACTLDLSVKVDEREYAYEYMLTKDERRMLVEKMETFFRQRVGTDLQRFSFERLTVPVAPG